MHPKGFLFDFDGTLYGDRGLWTATIQETLNDFQILVSQSEALEKARAMIGDGTFVNISGVAVAMAKQRGIGIEQQEVRTRFFEKLDRRMDMSGPGEELFTVLNGLRSANVRLAIVSFMRRPRLAKRLQRWKLEDTFQAVVTPEAFSEFKPSPAPFQAAMSRLNIEPAQCFVVGDEPVDMAGGKKAGARTVGLPKGFFTAEELKEAGAETIITSLSDLSKIVADP